MKIKRKLLLIVMLIAMGTIGVSAAQENFSFTINTENVLYTDLANKNNNATLATVHQSATNATTIACICNNVYTQKSSIVSLVRRDTKRPSYKGYNVKSPTRLKLRLRNPSSNGGRINVSGYWIP